MLEVRKKNRARRSHFQMETPCLTTSGLQSKFWAELAPVHIMIIFFEYLPTTSIKSQPSQWVKLPFLSFFSRSKPPRLEVRGQGAMQQLIWVPAARMAGFPKWWTIFFLRKSWGDLGGPWGDLGGPRKLVVILDLHTPKKSSFRLFKKSDKVPRWFCGKNKRPLNSLKLKVVPLRKF